MASSFRGVSGLFSSRSPFGESEPKPNGLIQSTDQPQPFQFSTPTIRKTSQKLRPIEPQLEKNIYLAGELSSDEIAEIDLKIHHVKSSKSSKDKYAKVLFLFIKNVALILELFFCSRAILYEILGVAPGSAEAIIASIKTFLGISEESGLVNLHLNEAQNKRHHQLIWLQVYKVPLVIRALLLVLQVYVFIFYFILYIPFPQTCHRLLAYLQEDSVKSYTEMLKQAEDGKFSKYTVPSLAKNYYSISGTVTFKELLLALRLDDATHRDSNHYLADMLSK